jgi:hypothetical protein
LGQWRGSVVLDGLGVTRIEATLDPQSRVSGKPRVLVENARHGFQGSNLNGIGFVISQEEAQELLSADSRNSEVIAPFLNGEDLNSSPTQNASRWVINFRDWPLERAETYPGPLAIVWARVKPQRDKLDDRKRRVRENWWKYEVLAPSLYGAISSLDRAIAVALTSRTLMPAFVATDFVYSHALGVFAYDDDPHLGILDSSFHWWWVVTYGSTMRTDVRYTIRDCFETFPQPNAVGGLHAARRLDVTRRGIMTDRNEGLTALYRRVHAADESAEDIVSLRQLHEELDDAVAHTYGWTELDLAHGLYETPQGIRYTIAPGARVEVMDRLLELNHERSASSSAA